MTVQPLVLPPRRALLQRLDSQWNRWQQENTIAEQSRLAAQRQLMQTTLAANVRLPQYSRWISSDYRRLFVVLDSWHGTRTEVKLLDINACQEIFFDTAAVLTLIDEGKLLAF